VLIENLKQRVHMQISNLRILAPLFAGKCGGFVINVLSGNLSHQIEHHFYPDLPANRYAAISQAKGLEDQITRRLGT
jgi:hypothetical protein